MLTLPAAHESLLAVAVGAIMSTVISASIIAPKGTGRNDQGPYAAVPTL